MQWHTDTPNCLCPIAEAALSIQGATVNQTFFVGGGGERRQWNTRGAYDGKRKGGKDVTALFACVCITHPRLSGSVVGNCQ